ncbi:MAG: YraN family protein [Lachnospiraceae bacterium]|nr:YraN family protein [Lachnospiraceae bacterium]
MENLRKKGGDYEARAAKYLSAQGYQIIERNFHCKMGEIDLIARDAEYLVFVEVKYRTTAAKGMPAEAVGFAKQRKICSAASYYLMKHGYLENVSVRFDVIAILGEDITLYRNAFPYIGYGR